MEQNNTISERIREVVRIQKREMLNNIIFSLKDLLLDKTLSTSNKIEILTSMQSFENERNKLDKVKAIVAKM